MSDVVPPPAPVPVHGVSKKKKKKTRLCTLPPCGNTAWVLQTIQDAQLQPFPAPEISNDEVLVEIRRVGICGSDVHYWQHGRIGDFVCCAPMVLGHESSGVVAEVGENVTDLAPGDRVALEPGVPCEECKQCLSGKYNLCPEIRFFATPGPHDEPGHGSLARYVAHPAKWCFKLPESVSLEEGAFCEPLSVGVYACEQKAKIQQGDSVVIFGAGPIGTLCALVANGMGAGRVLLVDIQESRLDFVKTILPDIVTLNSTDLSPEELAEQLKLKNNGAELDGAIDCCGKESAISAAIQACRSGSTVCLVGMGKPVISLPILKASIREISLEGVFRYRNTYPKCIALLSEKKLDVGPLLTHRFEFTAESLLDAFETCKTGVGKDGRTAIKCMISIEPGES